MPDKSRPDKSRPDKVIFLQPLRQAWGFARHPAGLAVLALLVGAGVGRGFYIDWLYSDRAIALAGASSLFMGSELMGSALIGVVVPAAVIFLLGRKLPLGTPDDVPAAIGKWAGLYVLFVLMDFVLRTAISLIFFTTTLAEMPALYSLVSGLIVSIVMFPLLVRLMALAVPLAQPQLGGVFVDVWSRYWPYLFWYVFWGVALGYALFIVQGTALGNSRELAVMVHGVLQGIDEAFPYLIAAAAAREMAPFNSNQAEVFS